MAVVHINGMSCQHCVASVKSALEEIPGISAVNVDLEQKQASYEGDVEADKVREAIVNIGFEVAD